MGGGYLGFGANLNFFCKCIDIRSSTFVRITFYEYKIKNYTSKVNYILEKCRSNHQDNFL